MRRFFSSFPGKWPGLGLLLLRLTLAGGLFADAVVRLHEPVIWQTVSATAEIVLGVASIVGVWMPLGGVVIFLFQLGMVVMNGATMEPALQRASIGLCLALLGPGAWSIDARLFGRRRVEIRNLRSS